jgi:hypothetical protein
MSYTKRTIKVSSENCQKLTRLGTLEDSINSLIEWLLGIYYDQEKKITTTPTGNRRAGTGEPNNTDMDIVAGAKRFVDDDSKIVSDDVIISSYLPRCPTDRCLKCSRHYVSEVYKK